MSFADQAACEAAGTPFCAWDTTVDCVAAGVIDHPSGGCIQFTAQTACEDEKISWCRWNRAPGCPTGVALSGDASQVGIFDAGPQGLGKGFVLSSGDIADAVPPAGSTGGDGTFKGKAYKWAGVADGTGKDIGGPADALCDGLLPPGSPATFDAVRLDFNIPVPPECHTLEYSFVVGSEEWPEFVGANVNDVAGLFVEDPAGKACNTALSLQGDAITINGPFFNGDTVISGDNAWEYDGSTPRITQQVYLRAPKGGGNGCGCMEHPQEKWLNLKVSAAVCDTGDGVFDTALFASNFRLLCSPADPPPTKCVPTFCGDGNLDPGEQCDDKNNVDTDACNNQCKLAQPPQCGDGKMEGIEECDDGNTVNDDQCSNCCKIVVPAPVPPVTSQPGFEVTGGACASTGTAPGAGLSLGMMLLLGGGLLLLLLLVGRRRWLQLALVAGLLSASLSPREAAAQDTLPSQNFHISPFMQDLLGVEKGDTAHGEYWWNLGVFMHYQLNPLVVRNTGSNTDIINELVHNQVQLNILGAIRVVDWFSVGLDVPVVLFQDGDEVPAIGLDEPDTAGLGDIRLLPRFRLLEVGSGLFI